MLVNSLKEPLTNIFQFWGAKQQTEGSIWIVTGLYVAHNQSNTTRYKINIFKAIRQKSYIGLTHLIG
jgi:hypothetical protein